MLYSEAIRAGCLIATRQGFGENLRINYERPDGEEPEFAACANGAALLALSGATRDQLFEDGGLVRQINICSDRDELYRLLGYGTACPRLEMPVGAYQGGTDRALLSCAEAQR